MVELLRTNNAVFISWLQAVLGGERIPVVVLDTHASVLGGGGAVIPRRLMVADRDLFRARRLLTDAGVALDDD